MGDDSMLQEWSNGVGRLRKLISIGNKVTTKGREGETQTE